MAARSQQLPSLAITHGWVDPVPGCGGEYQVIARPGRRLPGLERALHDLNAVKASHVPPRLLGKLRAEFYAGDRESASGKCDRRLAGAAADLEQPRSRPQSGELDELVNELGRIARAGQIVMLSGRVKSHPEPFPVAVHLPHHRAAAAWAATRYSARGQPGRSERRLRSISSRSALLSVRASAASYASAASAPRPSRRSRSARIACSR